MEINLDTAIAVDENSKRNNGGGLTDLLPSIDGAFGGATQQTISQPFTLGRSVSYTPISLQRIILSYAYMTLGIVQTLVDQPVKDAFRGGFKIKCPELDESDISLLMRTIKRSRRRDKRRTDKLNKKISWQAGNDNMKSDLASIVATCQWARLYGGAGLIVNSEQDFSKPFDINKINADSMIEFIDADRWELIMSGTNIWNTNDEIPFNYYGLKLNRSRVILAQGVEANSYVRLRLQGWGMSEIERCIRSINAYLKMETMAFELIDEKKIDVYKIKGFNDSLASPQATEMARMRIALSNALKNYQNAIIMDAEDEYEQKELSLQNVAELWQECRINVCSDTKMPMNKLFGQSAEGFGSGEDAIENYNSIVMDVREGAEPLIEEVADIRCMQLFGFVPEYTIEWPALKVLDGVQEEQVKTEKQNRILARFDRGLQTGQETMQEMKLEGITDMDTEVSEGLRDVDPAILMDQGNAEADRDMQASQNKNQKKSGQKN